MKAVFITSTILILLIAALRPILRGRIDPRMQYALWLIVALRLLLPVNFVTSAYSALTLLDRTGEPSRIVETIGRTAIPARSYDSARAQVIEGYHQQGVADSALTPGDLMDIDAQARELMKGPTLSELAEKYARSIWLGGAALMAAWFAFVNLRLRRKLKEAVPVEADCSLPVYLSDALPSPCLRGAFRPAVYVTPAVLECPDRLRHVLAHELTHCRQRDHWWALLRCLCLCLYWFDPLVWWAAALSRQDCELACDEGAICTLGEGERIPYGRTLVAMIAAGHNPLLQTATTMTGGKRRMRERVALIARKPKTMIAVALALVVIVGCAVGCTFTGAPEGSPDPTASQEPGPVASTALTADTLRERLLDIPENLRDNVEARPHADTDTLAVYYFKHPGEAVDESQYLLIVSEWSEEDFQKFDSEWSEEDFQKLNSGPGSLWFAKRGSYYYSFQWNTSIEYDWEEDKEQFNAAYLAVREFAKYTVLATEGMEPFDPSSYRMRLPADTLRERLLDVPEELTSTVTASASETKSGLNDIALAAYWWKTPTNQKGDNNSWLLSVHKTERSGFGSGAAYGDGVAETFAQDGEFYYTIERPVDARFQMEDSGSFTAAYQAIRDFAVQTVLETEGVEPFDPEASAPDSAQQTIQAVMDDIIAAPGTSFVLYHPEDGVNSRQYRTEAPPEGYRANVLSQFAAGFEWTQLTQEQAASLMAQGSGESLMIAPNGIASSSCIYVYKGIDLVAVRTPDNEMAWYEAESESEGETIGDIYWLWPGPYEKLRYWYDEVELDALRVTSVPDRGQSHEDVVKEWIEGYEGAMTKCAPGGTFTCTYIRAADVKADQPEGMTHEQLEAFGQHRDLSADEFGKTWFGFSYSLIFVPENGNAKIALEAGNTDDYTGSGAPEGAQICYRVAYMHLIDGNWVCEGTGTGW